MCTPDGFFDFSWEGKKGHILLGIWVGFLLLWAISNVFWNFPWFILFFVAFTAIHAISFGSLKYFYRAMKTLNEDLSGWKAFEKARYYYRKTNKTCINFIFPISFVLVFSVGGCMLYTNASPTPTFILFMIYFVIMVYFSMVIYLQYIRFFIYLYWVDQDSSSLRDLIQPSAPGRNPRVQWLQDMAGIACAMRYMFACVGSLYIGAFALFCFSPAYGASVTEPLFYFLWTLIFIFVVLVFLVVNYLNNRHMHKLRDRVKQAYVDELIVPENLSGDKKGGELNKLATLLRDVCITSVLNSSVFPVRDTSHDVASAGITLVQLIASFATLYEFVSHP